MFDGRRLVVATMHQKEKVIAPILNATLGVTCFVSHELNTDQFGTFSGEIARTLSPLNAARAKCDLAHQHTGCDLVLATEGSFGPHPNLFFRKVKPKVSVSNFKNVELENIYKGFYPFEFLKFKTHRDCRSYRIYGVSCHPA